MTFKRTKLLSYYALIALVSIISVIASSCGKKPDYHDTSLPAEVRADLLLKQMTLGEKATQMRNCQYVKIQSYVSPDGIVNVDSLKKYFPDGVGGINVALDLEPEVYVNVVNSIQDYNLKNTRLAIPAMCIGEGLHGFMSNRATMYPQAIALGCTWDTVLLEKLFGATALEASARGVKQLLSPVLDLGRDPRFGRIEEMYSEDAYLAGACGRSAVYGFQGRNGVIDSIHCASTLKHFLGHGSPEGGRNLAPVYMSTFDILNDQLLPFAMCVEAGARGVMPSYNEINGLPNHGNKWLLQDILRKELGFNGLITADQNAIDVMYTTHAIVPSYADAAKLAIECGVELDLQYMTGTYNLIEELVTTGQLDIKYVDAAVKRQLTLKFELGLFENCKADINHTKEVTNCEAHKAIALEAAEKSTVLLKNENNTLPFDASKIKKVAVIGPLADDVHFGGYTSEPRRGVSVLDGIKAYGEGKFDVVFAEGCKIAKEQSSFWRDDVQTPNDEASDLKLIDEAVKAAKNSDVIVLAIGETVSFSREAWGENHVGDRENLDLLGRQDLLVDKLLKTGKPVVALMFGGRPLSFNYVNENVPAIFQVFYPGQEGGHALANLIFGDVNPSGKLGTTIPKSVGNLPCFYAHKPSRFRSYVYNVGENNLYPFGYGISYTNYQYGKPVIDQTEITISGSVKVSVDVTNSGSVAGEEVVQLYIRDKISSGVRPVKELKDFSRVALQPGQTKTVTFTVTPDKLAFYNLKSKKVVEPGEFEAMVGPNSQDVQTVTFTVK